MKNKTYYGMYIAIFQSTQNWLLKEEEKDGREK